MNCIRRCSEVDKCYSYYSYDHIIPYNTTQYHVMAYRWTKVMLTLGWSTEVSAFVEMSRLQKTHSWIRMSVTGRALESGTSSVVLFGGWMSMRRVSRNRIMLPFLDAKITQVNCAKLIYSSLKTSRPWKIFTPKNIHPEKYLSLKNIPPWKIFRW